MLLLDSLYINNSGGRVLLDYLIQELYSADIDTFYLIDERCKGAYPFLPDDKVLYLKASLRNRHAFYQEHKEKFETALCFANIPPTVRLRAKVYTYFHNVLLAERPKGYPFKAGIKAYLKGIIIKRNRRNTDFFIVQSENVKNILLRFVKFPEAKCLVLPFYRELQSSVDVASKKNEFIYISNGNPHKNHTTLLEAWDILKHKYRLNIPLHLTVTNEYPGLLSAIEKYKSSGVPITNHGIVDVKKLYSNYKYSIYPSLTESFGLGLIESVDSGTEVIAADLPYVHAVIEPLATFNPYSSEEIALAVKDAVEEKSTVFRSKRKTSNKIQELIRLLKSEYY